MEWLFGLALLPLVLCGAMCAGGVVLAFLGIRRSQDPCRDEPAAPADESEGALEGF